MTTARTGYGFSGNGKPMAVAPATSVNTPAYRVRYTKRGMKNKTAAMSHDDAASKALVLALDNDNADIEIYKTSN